MQDPKTKEWFTSWEEAEEKVRAKSLRVDPTMFPSSETAELPLQHTMRFLPQDQDTGGFFVAVLEKVAECTDLIVPSVAHRKKRKPAAEVHLPFHAMAGCLLRTNNSSWAADIRVHQT